MINFHKFGFLDAKKLLQYVNNKDFWLNRYNPIWLFEWSDYYKPEIAFDNNFCYIRFLMPEIGITYYPPIGDIDIRRGMRIIEEDAKENGFDFNLAFVDENMYLNLVKAGYDLKENDGFANYIFLAEDLAFYKKKCYKEKRKLVKKFDQERPNTFYKIIKKEDFPNILEFIQKWHSQHENYKDTSFYRKLNCIKRLIEHLYEFDLLGIMLCDEENIYGIIIGNIYNNMAYIDLCITLDEFKGSEEKLLMSFAKVAQLDARYINWEEDMSSLELKKKLNSYSPLKLEKVYSTFRL